MQQFLKHYRVKIRVLSPIHIGSGEKIKKKEYIYMPWNHRVIIPNVEKMYEDVCARGWEKEFTSFLMDREMERCHCLPGLLKRNFGKQITKHGSSMKWTQGRLLSIVHRVQKRLMHL